MIPNVAIEVNFDRGETADAIRGPSMISQPRDAPPARR